MFAVMKHFDLMIGIDFHTCWPPPDPKPNGPAPYLTIMLLHGLQPLTPMMAPTCLTMSGMTMQQGSDIGPGIPHIGPPSKLTPVDILFSSSVSYFGPGSYTCEGVSVAAALMMVVGLNVNCTLYGPIPCGLVICPTTHFTGMTLMDILFGVICYGLDVAMEAATGAVSQAAGKQLKKRVIGPISKKLSAKLASRTAAKTAASATSSAASSATSSATSKVASKAAPSIGSHRPVTGAAAPGFKPATPSGPRPSAGGPSIGANRPGFRPATPSGPRPTGGPNIGANRPTFKPATPSGPRPTGGPNIGANRPGFKPATPSGPRPTGSPNIGANRPRPTGWQPAKPSPPPRPPNKWQPGKPSSPQRPPNRPTLGQHRPAPEPPKSLFDTLKDEGFDALMELLVSMPLSIPHQMTLELLAQSDVEEFGAPPEEQKEG